MKPEPFLDLSSVQVGDHLCVIYDNESLKSDAIISFLLRSLETGNEFYYLGTASVWFSVSNELITCYSDVNLRENRHTFFIEEGTNPNSFSLKDIDDWLRHELDLARSNDNRSLWVAVDLSELECLFEDSALDRLEKLLDGFVSTGRCAVLCLYGIRAKERSTLLNLVTFHPKVVYNGAMISDISNHNRFASSNRSIRDETTLSKQNSTDLLKRNDSGTLVKNDSKGQLDLILNHIFSANSHKRLLEQLHKLLNDADVGYFSTDSGGLISDVNQSWLDMHGFEHKEDVLGAHITTAHHANDRAKLSEIVNKGLQGEPFSQVRIRRRCKNGQTGYNIESLIPVALGDHIVGLEGIVLDVSKYIETEMALNQCESRCDRFFEDLVLGIFRSTSDGRILKVNSAFARMFGYSSPEDVMDQVDDVAKNLSADPVLRTKVVSMVQESFAPIQMEIPYRKRDGNLLYGNLHVWAVRDIDGSILHLEGFVEDITRKKMVEDDLRKSEEKYRMIVENIIDVIFATDINGRFTYISPQIEQLSGYKPEEVLGTDFRKYVYSDDLPEMEDSLVRTISGKLEPHDLRILAKDGRVLYIRTSSRPIMENGKPVGLTGVVADITYRKRSQEALQAAKDAAEAANRAKSDFLANISHEIRTPLNAIIGMASLLKETPIDPEQREFIDTMINSGDALLIIINEILDFSKIEERKMELEHMPFNLRDCIESSLDVLAKSAEDNGLVLAYEISGETRLDVLGDFNRLRQILVNLLSNAVKFTNAGEVIVLVSRGVGDRVNFEVKDTGIGIPEDRMNLLFHPFSQIDSSSTRQYGGTGLGLAICKRLVEMMHGAIWVESIVGKGSTFHFHVHLPPQSVQTPFKSDRLKGIKALLVERDGTLRGIHKRLLERFGLHVTLVEDLSLALDMITDSDNYDVTIVDSLVCDDKDLVNDLDLLLSQMVPTIILCPKGKLMDAAWTLQGHVDGVIPKPVKAAHLYQKLCEALGIKASLKSSSDIIKDTDITGDEERYDKLRVLLAEDNPVNRMVAQKMLSKLGITAHISSNGIEVIREVMNEAFDLIFMDIQMPLMDGIEATRIIRLKNIDQPWIIALTAHAIEGDKDKCIEVGMNDYLSKPVRMADLKDVLHRFQRSRQLSGCNS